MQNLTPRQQKFCQAYATTGVAETAAVAAGYSRRTARGSATRLLANAGIKRELDRLAEATESAAVADLTQLRQHWTAIIRDESENMPNRLRASELLGRSLGAFVERREHSAPGGWPLTRPVINVTLNRPTAEIWPDGVPNSNED